MIAGEQRQEEKEPDYKAVVRNVEALLIGMESTKQGQDMIWGLEQFIADSFKRGTPAHQNAAKYILSAYSQYPVLTQQELDASNERTA